VPALLGPVGKQILPAATAPKQGAHDRVQGRVVQGDRLIDAALGRVPQLDGVAPQPHVLTAHRSQAEAALVRVGPGRILIAADPERTDVQHPQRRGQHPIAAEPSPVELLADPRPHRGEPPAQPQYPVVLGHVAAASPLVVVAVLAPPGVIGADRLDVPAG